MGFFSWNCKGCGESIKAPYDIPRSIAWQNDAVVLMPNGSIVIGSYDGYGRLDTAELDDGDSYEWWHKRCWHEASKPSFTSPSSYASDQGFFYDDPVDEAMNAQTLLQGKRIVGVDNDVDNKLILMLEDGTNVVIDAVSKHIGNGMSLAVLEVNQSANPIGG